MDGKFFKNVTTALNRVRALKNGRGLQILKYIEDNPDYTQQQIATYLKVSQPAVAQSIGALEVAEILQKTYTDKGVKTEINYELLAKIAEAGL